jgi:hypothetical protein
MRVFVAAILLGLAPGPAAVAFNLERAKIACKPDVVRLCTLAEKTAAMFGSYDGVIACLAREAPMLSPACRAAIDRHAGSGR